MFACNLLLLPRRLSSLPLPLLRRKQSSPLPRSKGEGNHLPLGGGTEKDVEPSLFAILPRDPVTSPFKDKVVINLLLRLLHYNGEGEKEGFSVKIVALVVCCCPRGGHSSPSWPRMRPSTSFHLPSKVIFFPRSIYRIFRGPIVC